MRFKGEEFYRKSAAPSRWLGLALLLVFAHAFAAGATHFHRAENVVKKTSSSLSLKASLGEETRVSPEEVSGHAQCLLCRLQRNLIADLEGRRPDFAPPSQKLFDGRVASIPIPLNSPYLVPAGRAPPLV